MFYMAAAFDQDLCRWEKKDSALDSLFCSGGASCGSTTCQPTTSPSSPPSQFPSITFAPSQFPSISSSPSNSPSNTPSHIATNFPSYNPTVRKIHFKGYQCTDHYGAGKCELCSGHCDSDNDCAGDLLCLQRNEGVDVPGCSWGADGDIYKNSNTNFCKSGYCKFITIMMNASAFVCIVPSDGN